MEEVAGSFGALWLESWRWSFGCTDVLSLGGVAGQAPIIPLGSRRHSPRLPPQPVVP